MANEIGNTDYKEFLEQIKSRVVTSRYKAVRAVNNELTLLYHFVGTEIIKRQQDHG